MVKVALDLLAFDLVDVGVCHGQDAAPVLVAVCQLWVGDIEDLVLEGEIVGYSLVAINVEACLGLLNRCFHVRHLEDRAAIALGVEEMEEKRPGALH